MTVLTIRLPQRKLGQLRRFAERIGVSPSELVRGSVEGLLCKHDADFEKAAARVLKKNAPLCKRLERRTVEEKWKTSSLEWIHRVRAKMAKRGQRLPMPLAKQKALAAKFGLKLVRLRDRAEVE